MHDIISVTFGYTCHRDHRYDPRQIHEREVPLERKKSRSGAGYLASHYRRDDRLSSKGMMMDIIGNCLVPHQVLSAAAGRRERVGVSVLYVATPARCWEFARGYAYRVLRMHAELSSNETFLHRAPIPRNPLLVSCRT